MPKIADIHVIYAKGQTHFINEKGEYTLKTNIYGTKK